MKTIIAMYRKLDHAQTALRDLRDAQFNAENLSMISSDAKGDFKRYFDKDFKDAEPELADGTAAGAGVGAVLGGLGGFLVGLGALVIPGIGPVLAAGPLVATLAGAGVGAVAGGLVGALVDMGVPEEHAEYYGEAIRKGAVLIVVNAEDARAEDAMGILNRYHPMSLNEDLTDWNMDADAEDIYVKDALPGSSDEIEYNRTHETREVVPLTGAEIDDTIVSNDLPVESPTIAPLPDAIETLGVTSGLSKEMPAAGDRLDRRESGFERDMKDVDTVDASERDTSRLSTDDWHRVQHDSASFDAVCRPHYDSFYQVSGRTYDDLRPAYQFGYDLVGNRQYIGFDWDRIEPHARRDWETRGITGAWEDVKAAVRHAWQELRD